MKFVVERRFQIGRVNRYPRLNICLHRVWIPVEELSEGERYDLKPSPVLLAFLPIRPTAAYYIQFERLVQLRAYAKKASIWRPVERAIAELAFPEVASMKAMSRIRTKPRTEFKVLDTGWVTAPATVQGPDTKEVEFDVEAHLAAA